MTGALDTKAAQVAAALIDRLGRSVTITSAPGVGDYDRTDGSVSYSSSDYAWVAARVDEGAGFDGGDVRQSRRTVYYVPTQSAAGVAATFTLATGWTVDGRKVTRLELLGQDSTACWVAEAA